MTLPTAVQLSLLAAVMVGGFVLLEATIRRTLAGIVLVFVVTATNHLWPELPSLSFGGIEVLLRDVVGVLLLVAAIARLLRQPSVAPLQWVLFALAAVLFLSVGRGILVYGVAAVSEFRSYFWFVTIAMYCSTIEPRRPLFDLLGKAWVLYAGFFLLLSLTRWAVLPLGLGGWAEGPGGLRVVGSSPTLVLAQAFIIGAVAWSRPETPAYVRRLAPVFLGAVVVLQHRSVWASLLVAIVLMALMYRQVRSRMVSVVALAAMALVAFSLTVLDDVPEMTEQLGETAAYRGTWEWRVEGWRALIDESGPEGATEVLVGRPFGGGWERRTGGQLVDVSPHNFYVETYLRTGLLGLVLLAGLYMLLFFRLFRDRTEGLLSHRVLLLLLAVHPVFFIPYKPGPEQGVLLGLGIAAACAHHWRSPTPGSAFSSPLAR